MTITVAVVSQAINAHERALADASGGKDADALTFATGEEPVDGPDPHTQRRSDERSP